MRRTPYTTAARAAMLGLFICATIAVAEGPQDDLLGTWKGYRMARRSGGKAEEKVNHSFTVKALKEATAGKWDAEAVDGQNRPQPMTVSVIDGVVHVEYLTPGGGESIHLTLQAGTVLAGQARPRGSGANLAVRLEKQ